VFYGHRRREQRQEQEEEKKPLAGHLMHSWGDREDQTERISRAVLSVLCMSMSEAGVASESSQADWYCVCSLLPM
jgi:hypothetical protein